jgi:hypothetical protein
MRGGYAFDAQQETQMIDLGIVPLQSQGYFLKRGSSARIPRKYNFTVHVEVAVAFGLSTIPAMPHQLPPARMAEILMAEHKFLADLMKKPKSRTRAARRRPK